MPALNIMAIQDSRENSGRSPSLPSGMRPYLLNARKAAKITNAVAVSTKAQPKLVTRPFRTAVVTSAKTAGARTAASISRMTIESETNRTGRSSEAFEVSGPRVSAGRGSPVGGDPSMGSVEEDILSTVRAHFRGADPEASRESACRRLERMLRQW